MVDMDLTCFLPMVVDRKLLPPLSKVGPAYITSPQNADLRRQALLKSGSGMGRDR